MKIDELFIIFEERKSQFASLNHNRMIKLLEELGDPHKNQKYIHVAGTNGKGSTSNFIYNIIKNGGYRAGLYTSPHILRYNERIKINDVDISDDDLIRISNYVFKAEKNIEPEYGRVSLFEFITAVAFIYFKEQNTDYIILEVGMGGLSDSTNTILKEDKLAQVITPISMDHTQFLGKTLEEIAVQKAGIIKENVLTVTSNTNTEILNVLRKKAEEKNSKILTLDNIKVNNIRINSSGSKYDIEYHDIRLNNVGISLTGYYQLYNSVLALMTILELIRENKINIDESAIYKGLKEAKWSGRMETLKVNPLVVIDGAHNLDGIINLTKNLSLYKYNKLFIITSILEDKEHEKMLKVLSEYADEIILTDVNSSRKTDISDLKKEAEKNSASVFIEEKVEKAIEYALNKSNENDLILITGSLYLLSEIKKKIKWSV